jgi:antitoxin HigA-1
VLLYDFLEPLGVSQANFAKRIDVTPARLNEIIKGKRTVTPDTALRFERALDASAASWLNLQQIVDLFDAMHSENGRFCALDAPTTRSTKARNRPRDDSTPEEGKRASNCAAIWGIQVGISLLFLSS